MLLAVKLQSRWTAGVFAPVYRCGSPTPTQSAGRSLGRDKARKMRRYGSRLLVLQVTAIILLLAVLSTVGCGGSAITAAPAGTPVVTPAPTNPPAPPTSPPPPTIKSVVLVVLENKSYGQIIGDTADMPYLNSLAKQYALATNYYADGVESLPNYFMLTVGDTVATDASYTGPYTGDTVVHELVKAGKTWKAYAESLPSVGYLGSDQPPYMRIHNPFTYFSDVQNSSAQADNIVPFTQMAADLAAGKLPDYSFVIPNNSSNMHDCPPNMSSCTLSDVLQYGDSWLKNNIDPLLKNSDFQQSGILVITFDESNGSTVNGGGHVATVIAGAKVKTAFQSNAFYQHQSTLRMMMKALGVTSYPNSAANAPDMDEFFTGPLP